MCNPAADEIRSIPWSPIRGGGYFQVIRETAISLKPFGFSRKQ
jgi:hypothetical protein